MSRSARASGSQHDAGKAPEAAHNTDVQEQPSNQVEGTPGTSLLAPPGASPLLSGPGAGSPVSVLDRADQFIDSKAMLVKDLLARSQELNNEMEGIHRRLSALGHGMAMPATPGTLPAKIDGRTLRKGIKRGPNKPKAEAAAVAPAAKPNGNNKISKTGLVFEILSDNAGSPQFRRNGMKSKDILEIAKKLKPPLNSKEVGMALQSLTVSKRVTYTKGEGAAGRGGHYKPVKA